MSSAFSAMTNQQETIYYLLYDTQTFVNAATVTLAYFTTPSANFVLSNVETPGTIPQPKTFFVQAIRIIPKLAVSLNAGATVAGPATDMFALLYNSYLEFSIGDKTYFRAPGHIFSAGCGVIASFSGTFAAGSNLNNAVNGTPDNRNLFTFTQVPLAIPPQVNFKVTLNFNPAPTLTANNTQIMIALEGYLSRGVQ